MSKTVKVAKAGKCYVAYASDVVDEDHKKKAKLLSKAKTVRVFLLPDSQLMLEHFGPFGWIAERLSRTKIRSAARILRKTASALELALKKAKGRKS